MVTGERGQRAAAMMVGEVDRRETADAVKRRKCARKSNGVVIWFAMRTSNRKRRKVTSSNNTHDPYYLYVADF